MKIKSKVIYGLTILACQGFFSKVHAQGKIPPKQSVIKTQNPATFEAKKTNTEMPSQVIADRFADVQVLRYGVPGFNELTLKQKQLAYYLYETGLCGRDIYWDQKYSNNLLIRKTIENILTTYKGDKTTQNWKDFETYSKQVFFSNGIHHHYSNVKIKPKFPPVYVKDLLGNSTTAYYEKNFKMTWQQLSAFMNGQLFSDNVAMKTVDLAAGIDNVKASCNNFYENVTQDEVEAYYKLLSDANPSKNQPSYGLNSKLIKKDDKIMEQTWKVGGMYGSALAKMVYWLKKAVTVAENPTQKNAFIQLIAYLETGDLKNYDDYCISWVSDTASRIDIAIGFIEVYHDAIGKKGSYESVLSMKDLEASKMVATIAANAQWFEDNSPIMNEHKKQNVKGISAKVITVIGEGGDAAPATPIGINLPNSEWIREEYGSKSVSLGNIVAAYNYTRAKSPMIDEFGSSPEVIERVRKYGALCGDLHTDMHEVIGHASGQLNPGVPPTDITLKNYASALEEARADLVALYYILDPKLIEIGVCPSIEAGEAQYDLYILNGMMTQLYRIQPGDNIEEAHMRNRQLICHWVYENGEAEQVILRQEREGKTFFVINDYQKLRILFGQLLMEIQRLKSEGDFEAGKNLVETYGVVVDQPLLLEVHKRYEKLDIAPYNGFIQPKLIPVYDANKKITNVKLDCNQNFMDQMLEYGKNYSFLPVKN